MLMQTDIYSYGVILYELLTGQVPFPLSGGGDTGRNTVMISHMEKEIPDGLQLRKANLPDDWSQQKKNQEMHVPAWFIEIVYKCLQKKPEDRFANGIELHDAIISGIIPASAGPSAALSTAAFETENTRLHEPIPNKQNPSAFERDNNTVLVPKKILIGLATLFVFLFLYAVLSRKPADVSSNLIKANTYRSPYIFIKPYNYDSVMQVVRERKAKARLDSISKAKRKLKAKATKKAPPEKKKKRKKFLGIF
jgi:serine/threonine protein kinase